MRIFRTQPLTPNPSPSRGEGKNQREYLPVSAEFCAQMRACARDFRKIPTSSENILWQTLRNRQLAGFKFRRQQAIGGFVVDFFCAARNLIVEVDGAIHITQVERDRERQHLLETCGYTVVRFSATQVERQLEAVVQAIRSYLESPSPLEGEGLGVRGHNKRGLDDENL